VLLTDAVPVVIMYIVRIAHEAVCAIANLAIIARALCQMKKKQQHLLFSILCVTSGQHKYKYK